jgi:hypothetical protein
MIKLEYICNAWIHCFGEAKYWLIVFIAVVTGATDGVGKAYAEAVCISSSVSCLQ